jgi:hypothetical protein
MEETRQSPTTNFGKFTPDSLAKLRRDGYVVVPAVIPEPDCASIRADLAAETCEAYGVRGGTQCLDKELPEIIWRNQKVANLHGRGMWRARCHPSVVALFQELWFQIIDANELESRGIAAASEVKLCSSFDGFALTAPGKHGKDGQRMCGLFFLG